jgi:cytochrome P450
LLGTGHRFWRDPLRFLEEGAAQYGDAVRHRFGPRQVFIFRHPEQVRAVLVTRQRDFIKGGASPWFKAVAGLGLFTSEGELHRRQRRLAHPSFQPARINRYASVMSEYAMRHRERWADGQVLDINEEMRELAMEIVSKAIFDTDVEAEAHEIGTALTTIMRLFPRYAAAARYTLWLPSAKKSRLKQAKSRLDATIYRIIEERRRRGANGADFLSTLMNARDESGNGISDTQLRDELVTLFIAGHETAANALTWTWYLLATHPEVERKLHDEIDSVLSGRPPDAEAVPHLPYTEQVFSEALRLYPPLWVFGRRAIRDTEIGGYAVPEKTVVLVSPYLTHRDPRFFEHPLAFRPERWTPEMKASLPKFAYFPFSGGARQCLGDSFGWLEASLTISTVAQKWRMRLVEGHPVEPHPLATLRPRYGVKVVLERR